MENEKVTAEKLLESAKAEFLENGYMKASLRTICKNAGVTTGALYFFFKNKNDLFASIVEHPLRELLSVVSEHFREDEMVVSVPGWTEIPMTEHKNSHDEMQRKIIHIMYGNYDAFVLLLTKAQGSAYENYTDKLVSIIEANYKSVLKNTAGIKTSSNDYIIHWFSHMTVDAFSHLLLYEKNEEKALRYIDGVMHYIIRGTMDLLINPDNK